MNTRNQESTTRKELNDDELNQVSGGLDIFVGNDNQETSLHCPQCGWAKQFGVADPKYALHGSSIPSRCPQCGNENLSFKFT